MKIGSFFDYKKKLKRRRFLRHSIYAWLVAMHTYLHCFPLSLYRTIIILQIRILIFCQYL